MASCLVQSLHLRLVGLLWVRESCLDSWGASCIPPPCMVQVCVVRPPPRGLDPAPGKGVLLQM